MKSIRNKYDINAVCAKTKDIIQKSIRILLEVVRKNKLNKKSSYIQHHWPGCKLQK